MVDYLCGGGDHYYDHCTFVMEEEGGVITAPSTSATLKHGYVFQNCTIKGKGKYDLGRPWQNEPRCFWLNTTMEAKSTDAGWRSMGNLPTHFYEYNSMDANGNAIDLSKRQNSPTSTNTYSPIPARGICSLLQRAQRPRLDRQLARNRADRRVRGSHRRYRRQ